MIETLCGAEKSHWILLVMAGLSVLEAWLGKTEKTKSGSVLELILNLVVSITKRIFRKEG